MFTKIVKFKNGDYGIRKWSLVKGYKYRDLKEKNGDYWWYSTDKYYEENCRTYSLEEVIKKFKMICDKGTPLPEYKCKIWI